MRRSEVFAELRRRGVRVRIHRCRAVTDLAMFPIVGSTLCRRLAEVGIVNARALNEAKGMLALVFAGIARAT